MADRGRLAWGLGAAALAVCLLAGCGRRAAGAADSLTFNNGTEPETLDPARMTGNPEFRLAEGLFEGLVNRDPQTLAPVPGVAESWTVSSDGLVYTFRLRECRWSNGDPLTAADFLYAWRRVLTLDDPPASYVHQLFYLAGAQAFYEAPPAARDFAAVGVKAPDPRTLVVTLVRPTAYFLELCSFPTLFPVHRGCVETHGRLWTRAGNLVANGAFALAEHREKQYFLLRRNPHYWDVANVRLAQLKALALESDETAFRLYEAGELDWTSPVPLALIDELRARPDFRVAPFLSVYFYRVNVKRADRHLDDVRVRRALALALDRERLARDVLRAGERAATSFVPPEVGGYRPAPGPGFDPERARALLAEAGFPGGAGLPELEVLYNTTEGHRLIAEWAQEQWRRNLGVRARLRNAEWKVYLAETDALNYELARAGWIADYNDPHTFLELFQTDNGNNRTGWSNAEYDRLVAAAAAATDPEVRAAIYRQAEAILLDELPVIPFYFYVSKNLVRPTVGGWYGNPRDLHPLRCLSRRPEPGGA